MILLLTLERAESFTVLVGTRLANNSPDSLKLFSDTAQQLPPLLFFIPLSYHHPPNPAYSGASCQSSVSSSESAVLSRAAEAALVSVVALPRTLPSQAAEEGAVVPVGALSTITGNLDSRKALLDELSPAVDDDVSRVEFGGTIYVVGTIYDVQECVRFVKQLELVG